MKTLIIATVLAACINFPSGAQTEAQKKYGTPKLLHKFDLATMSFKGTPVEQGLYLLRPVRKFAHLGPALTALPPFLQRALSGQAPVVKPTAMTKYMAKMGITAAETGGSVTAPLAATTSGVTARYFVIHDASNLIPNLYGNNFPANVNTKDWGINNLSRYRSFESAHLFINRMGESITCNDMSKKIQGVKFESAGRNPGVGGKCLGAFIHVELIQPRSSDPGRKNDAIAIDPGFTNAQYKRLALVYLAGSTRKGSWLIPTFHAVIDEGFKDGHDDPQNFDLNQFITEIESLYVAMTANP